VLPDNEVVITVHYQEPAHMEVFLIRVFHRPTKVKHAVRGQGRRNEIPYINKALYQLEQRVAKHKHEQEKRGDI
jgi:hypothetical protein